MEIESLAFGLLLYLQLMFTHTEQHNMKKRKYPPQAPSKTNKKRPLQKLHMDPVKRQEKSARKIARKEVHCPEQVFMMCER
jgi:hypothetical protein